MKYSVEININLPLKKVVELFDNTDNLYKWMPNLLNFEHLDGKAGNVGAKSKLIYKMRGKQMEMIETITHKNLPAEMHSIYEAPGMWNLQENYFEEINENTTKWRSECEFKGQTFMMKTMLFLMPSAFKKESMNYLIRFKQFAESA